MTKEIENKEWHVRHDNEIWTDDDQHVALADSEELAAYIVRLHNTQPKLTRFWHEVNIRINYVARDKDGSWFGYENDIQINGDVWEQDDKNKDYVYQVELDDTVLCYLPAFPDWRASKLVRPKEENK